MVEVIALAAVCLAVIGFAIWTTTKILAASRGEFAALAAANVAAVRAERAEYERDAATKALAAEHERSKALEAYVNEIAANPNADLAADDVAGRLRRLLASQAAAPTGDPLPSVSDGAVLADPASSELHDTGPDGLLRPE